MRKNKIVNIFRKKAKNVSLNISLSMSVKMLVMLCTNVSKVEQTIFLISDYTHKNILEAWLERINMQQKKQTT